MNLPHRKWFSLEALFLQTYYLSTYYSSSMHVINAKHMYVFFKFIKKVNDKDILSRRFLREGFFLDPLTIH